MKLQLWGLMLSLIVFTTLTPVLAQESQNESFIEPSPCLFTTSLNDIECGMLNVPEDRSNPDSTMIKIHYAIISAQEESKRAEDAVIYLEGGPGGASLSGLGYLSILPFREINETRDMIFFDQRGVGLSRPVLNCRELLQVRSEMLNENVSPAETTKRELEPIQACHDRLVDEGVNLSAYNTTENAADVADLMRLLDYKAYNLYGISYGTQLGLTVIRDYPEQVRSAVLLSVAPLDANWIRDIPTNVQRGLDLFFSLCAEDTQCEKNYPNLETRFYELVEQLNQKPAQVKTPNIFGRLIDVVVRGDHYVEYAFASLYSSWTTSVLPDTILDGLNGNHEDIAAYRYGYIFADTGFSTGMHYSVVCADTLRNMEFNTLLGADDDFPQQQQALDQSLFADICEIWGVSASDQMDMALFESDVPALVVAGEIDPITPPSYSESTAKMLGNAQYILLPFHGHDFMDDNCSQRIIAEFVNTPNEKADTSCVAGIPRLRFDDPF